MEMGGNWELLDVKKWEWDLNVRREWEWVENGNEVIEMGGIWYEKSVPAHLYCRTGFGPLKRAALHGLQLVHSSARRAHTTPCCTATVLRDSLSRRPEPETI